MNKAVVRVWMERMMRGEAIPAPVGIEGPDGRIIPIGEDSLARCEAARLLGKEYSFYVIDKDTDPEKVEELRRYLDQRVEGN